MKFNSPYNQAQYLSFLKDKFDYQKLLAPITIANNDVKQFNKLGFITTYDRKKLPVFEAHIGPNTKLERNRVGLRNLVVQEIEKDASDGALAVYIDDENEQWRFSFIALKPKFKNNKIIIEQTASKRFTYLLGKGAQTRTAATRFNTINKQSTLKNLEEAFAVEPLSKEFYNKLYKWYEKAQEQVIFPNDEKINQNEHKQNSLIRLLTRLLFIWFLKEKKLINVDLFDKDKLKNIIDWDKDSSFYKAILQNLFFATLNRKIDKRSFRTTTNGNANSNNYLATNVYRYQQYFTNQNKQDIITLFAKTPFLNGGLFECLDREATDEEKQGYDNDNSIRPVKSAIRIDGFSDKDSNKLYFSNKLFFNNEQDLGLIDIFNQYQFTAIESTPLDIEVALDPELLGKVFENLLANYRKLTGSFYTPREIVNYMVDESLKQHFKTHTELAYEKINNLFTEGENTLNEAQIKTIINTIDILKILDPAVGSGAYPMGILQRLIFILNKIDPENNYFKQQQLDKVEKIPDNTSRNSAINAIKQVFSVKNKHNSYGKKLYLIENCIYGVDIQPIAILIAQLRFFISLTIEQQPDYTEENYGIIELPNLETKFIVANSLLPLGEIPKQRGLFDGNIEQLQQQLLEIRHKYFTAKTLKTKRKYREQDQQTRQTMLDELSNTGISEAVEKRMQKVVHWDLYNQNAVENWFDPEWQFGVKNGFDIVLGNPPYIRQESIREFKPHFKQNYQVFTGTADIYTYFYEKGFNLLSATGHLCYITSNKWMRAKYGEKLRYFFKNNTKLQQIIDFEGKQIFANATVDTNILLCSKTGDNKKFTYQKQLPDSKNSLFTMAISDLSDNAYTLQPPAILALKKKIEQIGTPLKEWDIKIYRGVLTGFNEAFIIDTAKKDELIAKDPKSAEIIKPILRGRDIKAYEHHWAGLWLINSHNNPPVNIDGYPAIKAHLEQYYPQLKKRQDKGITPYNLRNCAYLAEFEKEKIVWQRVTKQPMFCLVKSDIFIQDSMAFITTNENTNYLMAILNSKLIKLFVEMFVHKYGNTGYLLSNQYVEQLPIPKISTTAQQPFIELVNQILTAKKNNETTALLEAKIDKMVYRLYKLTVDEIKIIEDRK